ncbi:MAG: hypothetical protein U9Q62_03100 [Campylobacterota bacterium]|nr:hypothetical protein [Campylobacterota bacterium]
MRLLMGMIWLMLLISAGSAQNGTSEKGNVYRHPTGLSFWYPQSWQLQEQDEALQLVPNNVVSTQEGPSELFFVTGESVAGTGISRADNPQVISYCDQQVRSILPALQLQQDKEYVDLMGTQGIVLKWAGNNNAGKPIEGRAYIVISRGHALTLSAIAYKGLIDKRTDSLKKIFRSFVLGQGQQDPALVGSWNKLSSSYLENPDRIYQTAWSAARSATDEKSQLSFYADGRWHQVNSSHTIVGAGDIWLEDKSKDEYKGQWYADGKRLFMIYQDNTWEEFAYKVVSTGSGRELRTAVGKRVTIWNQ